MVHRRSIRFLREGLAFSICCNVAYFEPARLTRYILSLAFSVLYRVQIGCNVARGRVFASRQYHLFYGPSTMVLDRTAFQDEWQQGCTVSCESHRTVDEIVNLICFMCPKRGGSWPWDGYNRFSCLQLPPRFTKYLRPTAASADLFSFASRLKRPSSYPRKVIPEWFLNRWKTMKIDDNLCKSMQLDGNSWKSMIIY